jgi:hypothetical protein
VVHQDGDAARCGVQEPDWRGARSSTATTLPAASYGDMASSAPDGSAHFRTED